MSPNLQGLIPINIAIICKVGMDGSKTFMVDTLVQKLSYNKMFYSSTHFTVYYF
jgi:hypothetical protein